MIEEIVAARLLSLGATMYRCGLLFSVVAISIVLPSAGTTLQQLTLDQMIGKATEVVRGKAQRTNAEIRGSVIYTHYVLRVEDTWKPGSTSSSLDIMLPGGTVSGRTQTYAGTPDLDPNQDYVFFLWTSRTGHRQILGLSQGLFRVTTDAAGQVVATRLASPEPIVDAAGQPVTDAPLTISLADLKSRVLRSLK